MRLLSAILAFSVSCAPAPNDAPVSAVANAPLEENAAETAIAAVDRLLDRVAYAAPGLGVVVVSADEVLLRKIIGQRNAATGAPLVGETPIYIASQTKAYVGLLAAMLDAEGVLRLDDAIADHWPELRLPGGVDPADWTLRHLLTHQFPIQAGYITGMEAYVTELAAAEYPGLLAEHARARAPGFRYANIGYNIWAAILESATGTSWRSWLDEYVFGQLGLTRTSTRTSDFPLDELSWHHLWAGPEIGWHALRPKTDAMMQSAGGIVTSVDDMGRWLQVHLGGAAVRDSSIALETITTAHAVGVEVARSAPNAYELPCDGYALGWNRCYIDGSVVYVHGGGYTGARTIMAFSPELGVGISVFSNSDNMTGWLTANIAKLFFRATIAQERAAAEAEAIVADYAPRVSRFLDSRQQRRRDTRGRQSWGGWEWSPTPDALRQYVGRYESGDRYAVLEIELHEGTLQARVQDLLAVMEPARPDVFGTSTDPFDGPMEMRFERDAGGSIVSVRWSEPRLGGARRYSRVATER